jgi:hypothetical protein
VNNEEKYDELIKAGIKEYHDNEIESVMAAPQQIEASEEFKKNMEQFINGMGNSADGSTETNTDGNPVNNLHNNVPKKAGSHKMIKRIACVAVILIAGAAVIGIANKDVGARYMDFFREYLLGGFTEYKGTDKDANKTDGEFELTYIPEGFELSKETHEQNDKKNDGLYTYINGDKLLLFKYTTSEVAQFQLDNENLEHSYLVLDNGIKGDYYKCADGNDENKLVWKQDGYMCWINISGADETWAEKELLNVANGVREVRE